MGQTNEYGLLPCPFCGSKYVRFDHSVRWILEMDGRQRVYLRKVECMNCGAKIERWEDGTTPIGYAIEAMAALWNRRGIAEGGQQMSDLISRQAAIDARCNTWN